MKKLIKRTPLLRKWAVSAMDWIAGPFPGSRNYWERRYAVGGHSGSGSYRKFAEFKAEVLNAFVAENGIETVMEFGSGDGAQLELASYPNYLGFDVSSTAIALCREKFADDSTKTFKLVDDYSGERARLTLSLDVIYHLVEDGVFEAYMERLFASSEQYVIIYSSDEERPEAERSHVRHRAFSPWVEENLSRWRLKKRIPNRYPYRGDEDEGSFADFYVYERNES